MIELFNQVSTQCSKLVTQRYTTSFYLGIKMLDRHLRNPIYSLYGFVRFADEIVDTMHAFDKADLLQRFKKETYTSIEEGISLNPILNSFQSVVNNYNIDHQYIEQFFHSMEMDLEDVEYDQSQYEEYILGSAEVVGLMCLHVFCNGDKKRFDELKHGAMRLGSAFQKVNFLRDLKADNQELGRCYFPDLDLAELSPDKKASIEKDIHADFAVALKSIRELPTSSRFGVYTAFIYYKYLLLKIEKTPPQTLLKKRVRISNFRKLILLCSAKVRVKFGVF